MSAGSRAAGGLKGAGTGAAIGSVVPGVGTLVGAGVGGLLGALSGGGGSDFTPTAAPMIQTTDPAQLAQAAAQQQSALAQQQAFTNAVTAQGGLAHQSQVYNQLQGVAAGTGPNPAQAMLNQATGANVANQAAMAAGQRGAGANVGLMQRQAAMAGTNAQQQAAGQAASLQAQQSLNAIQQAGGIANTQAAQQAAANQNLNQFALQGQQNQLGAAGQLNNANVAMQSNINNVGAGLQEQQNQLGAAQTGGALQGLGSAAAAVAPMLMGQPRATIPGAPSEGTQAGYGINTMRSNPNAAPGNWAALAQGGEVHNMANKSHVSQSHVTGLAGLHHVMRKHGISVAGPAPVSMHVPAPKAVMAKGGKVPAMVSPGEIYLPPAKAKEVAKGKTSPLTAGKKIPGKAKVSGDSLKNDTVPAKLEEGGIVIPRSVMQSKDPASAAAKFVATVMAKHGMK